MEHEDGKRQQQKNVQQDAGEGVQEEARSRVQTPGICDHIQIEFVIGSDSLRDEERDADSEGE